MSITTTTFVHPSTSNTRDQFKYMNDDSPDSSSNEGTSIDNKIKNLKLKIPTVSSLDEPIKSASDAVTYEYGSFSDITMGSLMPDHMRHRASTSSSSQPQYSRNHSVQQANGYKNIAPKNTSNKPNQRTFNTLTTEEIESQSPSSFTKMLAETIRPPKLSPWRDTNEDLMDSKPPKKSPPTVSISQSKPKAAKPTIDVFKDDYDSSNEEDHSLIPTLPPQQQTTLQQQQQQQQQQEPSNKKVVIKKVAPKKKIETAAPKIENVEQPKPFANQELRVEKRGGLQNGIDAYLSTKPPEPKPAPQPRPSKSIKELWMENKRKEEEQRKEEEERKRKEEKERLERQREEEEQQERKRKQQEEQERKRKRQEEEERREKEEKERREREEKERREKEEKERREKEELERKKEETTRRKKEEKQRSIEEKNKKRKVEADDEEEPKKKKKKSETKSSREQKIQPVQQPIRKTKIESPDDKTKKDSPLKQPTTTNSQHTTVTSKNSPQAVVPSQPISSTTGNAKMKNSIARRIKHEADALIAQKNYSKGMTMYIRATVNFFEAAIQAEEDNDTTFALDIWSSTLQFWQQLFIKFQPKIAHEREKMGLMHVCLMLASWKSGVSKVLRRNKTNPPPNGFMTLSAQVMDYSKRKMDVTAKLINSQSAQVTSPGMQPGNVESPANTPSASPGGSTLTVGNTGNGVSPLAAAGSSMSDLKHDLRFLHHSTMLIDFQNSFEQFFLSMTQAQDLLPTDMKPIPCLSEGSGDFLTLMTKGIDAELVNNYISEKLRPFELTQEEEEEEDTQKVSRLKR